MHWWTVLKLTVIGLLPDITTTCWAYAKSKMTKTAETPVEEKPEEKPEEKQDGDKTDA